MEIIIILLNKAINFVKWHKKKKDVVLKKSFCPLIYMVFFACSWCI